MRKKINTEEKRSVIIGIKVKQETKDKVKYLSEAEAETISTYINRILEAHIETYTKLHKINWKKELGEKWIIKETTHNERINQRNG